MTQTPFRVQPVLDDENRFFWASGEDGRLRFLRCQDCGTYLHPPLPRCPACGSRAIAPETVSGRAEVFSYTVNHQPWDGDADPYVIVLVAFPEQDGLRLTSNLVGCAPDAVHVGMPVRVTFEQHDQVWFPLFEPMVRR
ncbi:MAG TPA: Zn-ribbon domain-containing OB-fold protein [Iamia sp.]|nr:Zn-ribbon domain-containing OB-fold protein [Iamia sp.]